MAVSFFFAGLPLKKSGFFCPAGGAVSRRLPRGLRCCPAPAPGIPPPASDFILWQKKILRRLFFRIRCFFCVFFPKPASKQAHEPVFQDRRLLVGPASACLMGRPGGRSRRLLVGPAWRLFPGRRGVAGLSRGQPRGRSALRGVWQACPEGRPRLFDGTAWRPFPALRGVTSLARGSCLEGRPCGGSRGGHQAIEKKSPESADSALRPPKKMPVRGKESLFSLPKEK